MISKIIFSLALITCIVLLFLDKKQSTNQPPKTPQKKPKTPSTNKKTIINKWSASVPLNNQSTTQQPIIMSTNLNTINNSNNQTFIPIGNYKTDIPIVSNLVVEDLGNGKIKFTTTEDGKKYYLTYSEEGDKTPTKDLDKGQLYWTTERNKEIVLYKNDKNLLFLNGNRNKQLYFMWYGEDTQNRQNDSGYLLLKDTDEVSLSSNPNLVTYFFEQTI